MVRPRTRIVRWAGIAVIGLVFTSGTCLDSRFLAQIVAETSVTAAVIAAEETMRNLYNSLAT